jgi:hypothetical protein
LGTSLTAGPHLSASGAKKRKGRRGGAGPAGERIGPTWAVARAGEKERPLAWNGCGPKIEERERERERRRKGFPFSFKISFQIHFSNIQTSIKENPCIRIMMHKHLLFLN